MTDHALRRRERAWRETGTAEAERAFRLAEVRAGVRTQASLTDLAVLRLPLRVEERNVVRRFVLDDPLLRHLPLVRSDHLLGPSAPYLHDALTRLQALTPVQAGQVAPLVRLDLIGSTEVRSRIRRIGCLGGYAQVRCLATAEPRRGVRLAGEPPLRPQHRDALKRGLRDVYRAQGYFNGLTVHLLAAREHAVDSRSVDFQHAGWVAFRKIAAQLAVRRIPWVTVPSGRKQRLARALNRGTPWEFLEWRPA